MKTPRKKYKSVIIMGLKNIWLGIIGSQKLEQDYYKNNRHRENLESRFQQQKLYLHRKKTTNWLF